jgi:histidinol-phosphate phosphatase family protein
VLSRRSKLSWDRLPVVSSDSQCVRQIVVLAGGKGTRLASFSGGLPKALVPVKGTAVLERILRQAEEARFEEALVLLGYQADLIQRTLQTGSYKIPLRLVCESKPLGTAGAVLSAFELLREHFLVVYADVLMDVDLMSFCNFHAAKAADATLFCHPNDHPDDSDLVDVDEVGRIRRFFSHPHPENLATRNLSNAALYCIRKSSLAAWRIHDAPLDFAKGLFPSMLERGTRMYGYLSREYIKDMGTPERLCCVERDLESGLVAGLRLGRSMPAVFFDRDGVVNVERGHITSEDDVEVYAGVAEALKLLKSAGYLCVVVTNQPAVARGECSLETLGRIHGRIDMLLGRSGAYFDAWYCCPHHPDRGFPGEVQVLKITCNCRKPATGMLEQCRKDLNVDLKSSWLIGDQTRDIQMATNAGLSSILVTTGFAGTDRKYEAKPLYIAEDCLHAARLICSKRLGSFETNRFAFSKMKPLACLRLTPPRPAAAHPGADRRSASGH